MTAAARNLLWFRPLSPLNYALPAALAGQPWAGAWHIPMDTLQANPITPADAQSLQIAPVWLLSSPTAAYLAAKLGKPTTIAVMGTPTQTAWGEAGGAQPHEWLVSPTGESMGLLNALSTLSQQPRVAVLRGKQGRNDLIHALELSGHPITTVAMYEKIPNPQFTEQFITAAQHPLVTLYFTSTDQPARALAAAVQPAKLLASAVLVSHERIAAAARGLGFSDIQLHKTDL